MHIAVIILSGLLGHLSFNRLEPERVPVIFALLLGPPTALAAFFYATYNATYLDMILCYVLYVSVLIASTVTYRLSPFHPLARFPGPIICKITRLWAFYIACTGKQHIYYKSLHERYGTHVRTGPNHLFINDVDAIPTILGNKGFPRGRRYEISRLPGSPGNLLTITDLQEHARRRRRWDRGLNTNAIQGYHAPLEARTKQLVRALESLQGEINLSSWLSSFSFDFMGDLAFGGAFKLMEQGGDVDGHVVTSRLAVRHQELVGTIPWIAPFQGLFSSWVSDIRRFRQFSRDSVLSRKAQGSSRKDIFFHLLDEEESGSGPLPLITLVLEASLAIVAGSDTTGTVLCNIFFSLISHPATLTRLRAEVDATFPPGSDTFVPSLLGEMEYLNAVINETMRLYPAVPSGVQRVISKDRGGAIIAGRWVPASTNMQVPTYTLQRDARYYSPDPESFRPERWLGEPGFHTDQSALIPFSYGPMNCPGKSLALQEIRTVVCSLIQKFEFEFAKGWQMEEWENVQEDGFVLTVGPMPAVLLPRT